MNALSGKELCGQTFQLLRSSQTGTSLPFLLLCLPEGTLWNL